MKKIFYLVLPLLITTSCVESELIVPGENIGDGSWTEPDNPTVSNLLQQYDLNIPNLFNNKFNFDTNGYISNMSSSVEIPLIGSEEITVSYIYENSKVKEVNYNGNSGFHSNSYTFTYDDSDRIQEVSANTTPETRMVFNYDTNDIIATRFVDGTEDAVITFGRNGQDFFTDYSIAFANSETYQYSTTFRNNNLIQEKYSRNGVGFYDFTFTYDDKTNPVKAQISNNFLDIFVVTDAFDTESIQSSNAGELIIPASSTLMSMNNQLQVTDNLTGINVSFYTFNYTYTDQNFPLNATITNSVGEEGTVVFTYN